MRNADAVVVGGGVIGCAIAWALAREGLAVVLVERDRIGAHASGAAAGMLAPLAESEGEGALYRAGLAALELFPAFAAEARELSGIDPQFVASGVLRVAGARESDALAARARSLAGLGVEWLSPDEARKREPRLAPDLRGALWSPREGHVDPALLTRALGAAAARRGARFEVGADAVGLLREGDRVCGVRLRGGVVEAAEVVLCTGAWTRSFEDVTGASLPIEPVRGQILALESREPAPRAIVWGDDAYVVPRTSGTLLVGATVERAGFDVRVTAAGVGALVRGATALLPDLAQASFLRAWAGLRPGTPDGLALVGRVPRLRGLCVAAGHYRNGILLAPLTALWLADLLVRGRLPDDAAPFDPARFGR
jgi:glycine oxidase